jgi:hypothetical protein
MKYGLLLFLAVFVACGILYELPAQAYSLSFNPSSQEISVSGTASVNVGVSLNADENLSWFGMNVTYQDKNMSDISFIMVSNATVAPAFTLDSPIGYSLHSTYGIISIFATSSVPQTGTLTLATITFDGRDLGTANLAFGTSVLRNSAGSELNHESKIGGSITVSEGIVGVPEPATFSFLALGFLGFGVLKRKSQN